ncbi:hypothetical protein BCR42DRAFT_442686 [Absidia repens]|uniref:Uncharacterized protein n=1 Tax=Absidia repens TaxID=90262 RepID=A0A1X2I1C5_9FUNG|nr:hypothetical protein BCR42DRAFT_442686 [Absidia repens]
MGGTKTYVSVNIAVVCVQPVFYVNNKVAHHAPVIMEKKNVTTLKREEELSTFNPMVISSFSSTATVYRQNHRYRCPTLVLMALTTLTCWIKLPHGVFVLGVSDGGSDDSNGPEDSI